MQHWAPRAHCGQWWHRHLRRNFPSHDVVGTQRKHFSAAASSRKSTRSLLQRAARVTRHPGNTRARVLRCALKACVELHRQVRREANVIAGPNEIIAIDVPCAQIRHGQSLEQPQVYVRVCVCVGGGGSREWHSRGSRPSANAPFLTTTSRTYSQNLSTSSSVTSKNSTAVAHVTVRVMLGLGLGYHPLLHDAHTTWRQQCQCNRAFTHCA